ncbi:MAG: hypothetical protein HOL04_05460 [Gammaproteobacteria bacterium]|nr:hypothetical protein [Gammaproteobacteria bacterium]MBT4608092.1 hypothetical protein [Thiotrichales bacterium]MBT3471985.1 hypothetical protein [Gammaproteobacteria bacterium]MBT3968211.1 hypothetical protein [Gammaproteobacteria bacterium]MBT4080465.1 hypothetical protein [Gammaproteobacteria bacterium]
MRLILLLIAFLPTMSMAQGERVQVVYHIATADHYRQHIALLNLENHLVDIKEQQADATIKVLLEGDGVLLFSRALYEAHLQQRIVSLRRNGVLFLLGMDSVQQRGLDLKQDLLGSAVDEVVESGILTLINLQQQGFAYVPYVSR